MWINSQIKRCRSYEEKLGTSMFMKWQPTPVLVPGKFHGLRRLVGYSPWGRKESDTTERLHFHFSMFSKCTQFSSVQSLNRVRLCDPMNCSTPGLPVHHHLPEFTQTHVHRVSDSLQISMCLPTQNLFDLLLYWFFFLNKASLHRHSRGHFWWLNQIQKSGHGAESFNLLFLIRFSW